MESQQKHVIHLYEFEQQSINEKQLSKQILDSLRPYIGERNPQIKIKGQRNKYWAYFQIDPDIAFKLNQLKKIRIGDQDVHVGRFYYDHQIFIKKLGSNVTQNQVREYFQQFGQVESLVITEPVDRKNEDFKHSYIKMKDEKVIDKVILAKIHKLQGIQIKPVRTFGLNQDLQSDKKLILKIQGIIDSFEDFQQNAIQYFMRHGKMRERPKVEQNNNKYKMIITFTNAKDASNALEAFQTSSFYSDCQKKNIFLNLSFYFHTKQNKIYVSLLKENSPNVIKQAFSHFGQISELSLNKGKFPNTFTAVIGYVNQNDFKMALATYNQVAKITKLFSGKPYVTIYMTNDQKKSYNKMKEKQYQSNQIPKQFNQFGSYPPKAMEFNPQFRMQQGFPIQNQNIPMNLPFPNQPLMGQFPNQPMIGGQFNPQFNNPQIGQFNQPAIGQFSQGTPMTGNRNLQMPPPPQSKIN